MPVPAGFNPEYAECPKCGGAMWDNRTTKKSPKAPDFKCKDKGVCDGAVWMQAKGAAGPSNRPAGAGSPPTPSLSPEQKKAGRDKVFADYFGLMHLVAERMSAIAKANGQVLHMENVQAATYSVYSMLDRKRYLSDPAAKVATEPKRIPSPPVRQPEPEPEPEFDDSDELPF